MSERERIEKLVAAMGPQWCIWCDERMVGLHVCVDSDVQRVRGRRVTEEDVDW